VVTDSSFTSADRIESVSGTAQVGFSSYWRPSNDDTFLQSSFDSYGRDQNPSQPQYTPLVASQAAAFPASEDYADNGPSVSLFSSDLLRAVSIYESNMRLFSGSYATQGSVINRYS
jgi:hypothetical protein